MGEEINIDLFNLAFFSGIMGRPVYMNICVYVHVYKPYPLSHCPTASEN